ncbi:DUF2937 family protein [Thalassotalea mangrovi]|uniref:DUF2937 family protein n=1 Tax=Thalassotalea mangrovi TaxID=2572245 RepID=A0A4V5NUD0_9GAMM|nr:DUF2937 family protein [Thalassotalea mangrovi]TKB45844.1 DUF2937 family protein [Thalassotalea mangrovi]
MFHFIASIIDRLIFMVTFIVGMQLPAFINAYRQRVAGHLDEAQIQLLNFQSIADKHHQGDITQLLAAYRSSADPGVNASAELVLNLIDRIALLKNHLSKLSEGEYVQQIYYFITGLDSTIAKATLNDYQIALPVELSALATGLLVALSATILVSQTAGRLLPQR